MYAVDICTLVVQLDMCEESLFECSCGRWCSVCGSLRSCSVREGKRRRERRGVCSGQRPPAAINHGDSRSTAREVLRLTPASPGGGSYTGLKIHPTPSSSCHVPASPKPKGGRNKEGGRGEGERNLSALLGHITQFHCQRPSTYEEPSNVSAWLKYSLFHY